VSNVASYLVVQGNGDFRLISDLAAEVRTSLDAMEAAQSDLERADLVWMSLQAILPSGHVVPVRVVDLVVTADGTSGRVVRDDTGREIASFGMALVQV
jgi:hypothetical protein